jgi:hypothetical protein
MKLVDTTGTGLADIEAARRLAVDVEAGLRAGPPSRGQSGVGVAVVGAAVRADDVREVLLRSGSTRT